MYKKIENKSSSQCEHDVLKFWDENKVIEKSFNLNSEGEYFTFYDGPPTANGKPHIGHVITRVMKDIIPRFKVMKGYKVLRKAGWDTHGLPVELEVEKALGISGKPEIEKYGVEEFIKKCKDSVFTYSNQWKEMSERIGFWVDMEKPYVTYHNNYIESVWWSLSELWKKGLIYKGHKVVPYCPRCGTALSSHEVAQGYHDVKESSVFAKFKIKDENKYLLAWTTTPWTLPNNLAIAINKKYDYVEILNKDEVLILSKDLLNVIDGEYEILKEFKGEEILGTKYEPLFPFNEVRKNSNQVVHGDFVTISDGSGLVHIAPYGEDDSFIIKKYDIDMGELYVNSEGKFVDSAEPFNGLFVKKADPKIIEYMRNNNTLYKEEKFEHSYPFCWRCDTTLLYYPRESWFINMSSKREELLENNAKINWYPANVGTGRFGKFLENVIDWSISRERYWGTPLPIWECECGHRHAIGSIKELKEKGINVPDNIELHKPYIDKVKIKCDNCGNEMKRVPEVIDCWYDSGAMPFAQHHYPFENQEIFKDNFPADFISEAVDQTRGWFYSLHAIGTALFETNTYKNCLVLGHILDKNGQKMSKHKGNVLEPMTVIENQGADAVRWYFYTSSAPWLPSRFYEEAVNEAQRKFIGTLWNVYSFYVLYAELDNFNPYDYNNHKFENAMDKWVLSKLNTLIKTVEDDLEGYRITQAALSIEEFVDELSNWYVRRNRGRYWTEDLTEDKISAYITLHHVLVTLCKVAAPFIPFVTEEIYQNLVVNLNENAPISVHLCTWPEYDVTMVNSELEGEMELSYKVVKLGRAARNIAGIKNRQPLSKMLLSTDKIPDYYKEIIKDELNIKDIEFGADLSKYVNFEIKPNLPVLGKAYGKFIPQIKKEILSRNQMELASSIQSGNSIVLNINDTEIELNSGNLLINMEGLEGYGFAGEGNIGVILDTTITHELKEEGYVREVISKIQNIRKDKGYEVTDKINLYVGNNDNLINIIVKFEDHIKKETLSIDVIYNESKEYEEYNINGEKLSIFTEVIKN